MNYDSSTERVIEDLKAQVAIREPGERLPSTRQLIDAHRVSPVTVARALAVLVSQGAIVTRPGAGSFVGPRKKAPVQADFSWQTVALGERTAEPGPMASMTQGGSEEGVISLGTGFLHSSLLPARALAAALSRAGRLPNAWEPAPIGGLRSLRTWFARSVGPQVDPADVLITSGGQSAISAAVRALVPAGEALLVESPTYPGVLNVARSSGIRIVPVPTDIDGVIPELLSEAFARSGARAFYCQPRFHNPTGAVLESSRRKAVLEIAYAANAFVIEDDFARWLSHDPSTQSSLLSSDDDGRVVYITSLSKPIAPSLRVGALISRGPVAERLSAMRLIDELFVSRVIQEAAIEFVTGPGGERHFRSLAATLSRRFQVASAAIDRCLPTATLDLVPRGGFHLWLRLPPGSDDAVVASQAHKGGVLVQPGHPFYPAETSSSHIRITATSAGTDADLVEGIHRLATVLASSNG